MTIKPTYSLLKRSLTAAVFLAWADLAASFSFGLMELSAALLAVVLAAAAWRERRALWSRFLAQPPALRWFLLLLTAYLLWDAAGLLYSPSLPYALPKYPGELLGGCLFAGVCLSAAQAKGTPNAPPGSPGLPPPGEGLWLARDLPAALWRAALLAAALAVAGCFWPELVGVPYTLRVSLRRDYNVFATVLLAGWCCGLYSLSGSRPPAALRRYGELCAGSVLLLSALLLSGSRRTLLLLPLVLLLLLPVWLGREARRSPFSLIQAVAALLVTALAVWGAAVLLSQQLERQYQRYGQSPGGPGQETALADRYATISDSSMLEKRLLIWSAALDALKGYSPLQWAVGRGAAYDILLYDRLDDPQLTASYGGADVTGAMSAHSFLLADALNGGLVKLLLGLGLTLSLLLCWWRALRRDAFCGLTLACLLGLAYANSLISNRYGLLYDRLFWLAAGLTLAAALDRDGSVPTPQ